MASNDNYVGALEVLAKQISTMMGLADANLPFCVQLLEQVTAERRSPELAMQQAGMLPPGGGNPMGAQELGLPPGAGVGAPPMGPGGPGGPGVGPMGGLSGGVGGASAPVPSFLGDGVPGAGPQTAPTPNPDELLRVLTA